MRLRKGQKVRFKFQGKKLNAVIESVCYHDVLLYVESFPINSTHGRDGKCYWLGRGELELVRTPRTRIDKLINAYCEAEFKQMGISR